MIVFPLCALFKHIWFLGSNFTMLCRFIGLQNHIVISSNWHIFSQWGKMSSPSRNIVRKAPTDVAI
jgi:hypothetical protein